MADLDQSIRDRLRSVGGDSGATDASVFDRVVARRNAVRLRRRVRIAGTAALAALLVAGAAFAIADGDDEANRVITKPPVPTTAVDVPATTTSMVQEAANVPSTIAASRQPSATLSKVTTTTTPLDPPPATLVAVEESGGISEIDTADSTRRRTLVSQNGNEQVFDPALSPDSATLYYSYRLGTTCEVREIPRAGGPSRTVVARGIDAAPSPDGRHLAYLSTDAGCEKDALVVRDLESGAERRWPANRMDLSGVEWSPDGRRLAFEHLARDGWEVWIVDTTAAPAPLPTGVRAGPPGTAENGTAAPVFRDDGVLMAATGVGSWGRWAGNPEQIVAFDPATGRELEVVVASNRYFWPEDSRGRHLLCLDSPDSDLVTEPDPRPIAVRLVDGRQIDIANDITQAIWG